MDSTRREFCSCAAAALAAVGLSACASPTSPSSSVPRLASAPATVSGRTVSIVVDAASGLSTTGSAVMVPTSLGTFLVSRTGDNAFTALTATCTHQGCTIDSFGSGQFVCLCHGARFTTGGAVAMGPASTALRQYPTQFADNVLTFAV